MLPGARCCLGKPAIVLIGGSLLLACLTALALARRRAMPSARSRRHVTIGLGALFVVCYALVLGLTMMFLDANQAPDDRLMTPIFVAVVVMLFDLIRRLDGPHGGWGRVARAAAGVVCITLIALGVAAQARSGVDQSTHGRGFTHVAWQRSPTIARARQLPLDALIYSNRPAAIRFLAERPAVGVPIKRDLHTNRSNPNYPAELAALRERLLAGRVYLVWFHTDMWAEEFYPALREFDDVLRLQATHREPDGAVVAPRIPLPSGERVG